MDDRVPEHRDSHASSSHESSLEPKPARSADLGKHRVHTHFPEDRSCEICQRTKNTRAPCRRRIGGAVLRAENFGDLITADHKVFSDNCESGNNHRYAVVVQDLATQRIQSYSCKTKASQETEKSLQKFWEPTRKPKVIYTDKSQGFCKACEDLAWNLCTSWRFCLSDEEGRKQHHSKEEEAGGATQKKEEGKAAPPKKREEKAAAPEKGERQTKVVVHPLLLGRWCPLPILGGAAFSSLLLGGAGWFCDLPPPPPLTFTEV